MMDDVKKLNNNKTDHLVSVLKSVVGEIPIAGSALSEIIQVAIPKQRLDRVIDFIKLLALKCENIEEKLDSRNIFYIEEGIRISAKTYHEEKRKWLSNIISEGISDQIDIDLVEKLLKIIDELSVEQVIVLNFFYKKNNSSEIIELEKQYPEILYSRFLDKSDYEKSRFYQNNFTFNLNILNNYGLIEKKLTSTKSSHYSFPTKYDGAAINHILEDSLNDIYKVFNEMNRHETFSISEIGKKLIKVITE